MLVKDARGIAVNDVREAGRVGEAEDTVSVLLRGVLAGDTGRSEETRVEKGVRGHTKDHILAHKQWQCSPSSWSGIRHGYANLSSS